MNNREKQPLATTALNNNLRVEQIIWLAGQSDQYAEDLCDFFNDGIVEPEYLEKIIGVKLTAKERELLDDGDFTNDNIGDVLARMARKGRIGFLVKAATPCPHDFYEGGYSHSGFGYYTTEWFYTDVLDAEFMATLAEWKNKYIAEQRKLFEQRQLTKS